MKNTIIVYDNNYYVSKIWKKDYLTKKSYLDYDLTENKKEALRFTLEEAKKTMKRIRTRKLSLESEEK